MYPNPTSTTLNIELEKGNYSFVTMDIISMPEKIIDSYELMEKLNAIDVSKLPSGFYYIVIQSEGVELYREKVIVK